MEESQVNYREFERSWAIAVAAIFMVAAFAIAAVAIVGVENVLLAGSFTVAVLLYPALKLSVLIEEVVG
jgi:hypothetical protein